MKRGEIYYITSYQQEVGSEIRAGRPAGIVSNNINNATADIVEVCYLTTQPKPDLPTHVMTRGTGTPSTILCEQITTVSMQRVSNYAGSLTDAELQALNAALAVSLGLGDMVKEKTVMREPTPEELERLAKEYFEKQMRENPPKLVTVEPDAKAVKLKTERDLYKKFTEELLDVMKGGRYGEPRRDPVVEKR